MSPTTSAPFNEDTLLELMAFADGELQGEDLARVEALVASNAEAERVVASLRTLGDCVRVVHGQRPVPKIVDRIADDVMSLLPSNVVQLDPRTRRRNTAVAGAVCAALAVAAGWFLFVRTADPIGDPAPVASIAPASPAVAPSAVPTSLPKQHGLGVDLETLESASAQVSVFYLPSVTSESNENASSVVLWVDDQGGSK